MQIKKKKLLLLVDRLFKIHMSLASAIEKADPTISVTLREISDIDVLIENNNVRISIEGEEIKNFDLVFFRRIGDLHIVGSVIVYLDKMGVPFIDEGLRKTAVRMDKLTSLVRCVFAGIETIPTYYCHFKHIDKNIKILGGKFGYPIIAKKIHEHFLRGVYVIKNEGDIKLLKQNAKNNKNKRFIFQPFISIKDEYRLLVLGDKVKSINTRPTRNFKKLKVDYLDQNEYEVYLRNASIPKEIRDLAVRSAKVLDLQIAGVDICIEEKTGRIYVLEVNRGPAFNYDTKMSPEVPEVVKYIVWRLKK